MADDLLDYWVGLIKIIFPENAWIASRFSNNDHLIQIDWKLEDDPRHPHRRSKKIEIIIKEASIDDYLSKNPEDRAASDVLLQALVRERFDHFNSDGYMWATTYAPVERWLIPRHIFNGKPPRKLDS